MKIVETKTENRTTTIKVELDAAEIEAASDETYKRLNKQIVVPGFRKNKAPKQLLINHVGKDAFNTEVYEDYIPGVTNKIIEDEKMDIYARPYVHVIGEDPVTFEAVIPLTPIVELCDYKAVRIDPKKIEVREEEVNAVIDRFRKQNAKWQESDGEVEENDIVTMDIDSHSGDEPFIQQKGMPFQITKDSDYPAPGFSEALIGLKKDEEKTFSLTFKEPDYNLPGEENKDEEKKEEKPDRIIEFTVKITEIRKEQLAELTDDFAKMIMPTCKDVESLKNVVRDELMHREEDNARDAYNTEVMEKIAEGSKIEYPDFLVENEIDTMIQEFYERVSKSVNSQEEYDSIVNGTKEEDLRKTYRPSAEVRVKNNLIITKVMELEKIETTDAEVDEQLDRFVSDAPDPEKRRAALNTEENRNNIKLWNSSSKTLKALLGFASTDWTDEEKKTLEHHHHHHDDDAAEEAAEE
jgi:trigger factor